MPKNPHRPQSLLLGHRSSTHLSSVCARISNCPPTENRVSHLECVNSFQNHAWNFQGVFFFGPGLRVAKTFFARLRSASPHSRTLTPPILDSGGTAKLFFATCH